MAARLRQQFIGNFGGDEIMDLALTNLVAGNSLLIMGHWTDSGGADSNFVTASMSGETVSMFSQRDATLAGAALSEISGYVKKLTSGGSKTLHMELGVGFIGGSEIYCWELSGLDTNAETFAIENFATGSGTLAECSVTVPVPWRESLVFTHWAGSNGDPTALTGPYTRIVQTNVSWWDEASYNLNAGGPGVKVPGFVIGSADWSVNAVALPVNSAQITKPKGLKRRWGMLRELDVRRWF